MPDPITKVYILDVPLEKDYKNTLYFANASAQQTYFQSRVIRSFTDFTYQRKDNIIRLPVEYDSIYHANYVMYQNTNYSNKWFYAFITELEYINDGLTYAHIETDVMQTWMFDYNVKSSFIEREHTNNDTVGSNTVPENLELGEYVCNDLTIDNELGDLVYVIQVTEYTSGSKPLAVNYGGVYAPGGAYICTSITQVTSIISALDGAGKGDAVTNVYMVPRKIITMSQSDMQYPGQSDPITYEVSANKPTDIDSYSPRNNKLFTYPYCYMILDNNNGTSNILQYENFSTDDCKFDVSGVPTVGGSIKCIPKFYKNIGLNQQEGIMGGKFPICGWVNDTYTNWLTQNSVNIGVGIASSGLSIVGGLGLMATGAGAVSGASAVVSGAMGIANSVGQIYQHSLIPNSARGNTNGGDINTCYNMNKFYFLGMSIKEEYAKIIDDYFSMFGYKTNRVKIPNKNHRQRWWYTKTIDVNIDGNIPQNDMQIIKNCYNNGITFWRNASEIENYSLSNNII
jgi:hypothetical protein